MEIYYSFVINLDDTDMDELSGGMESEFEEEENAATASYFKVCSRIDPNFGECVLNSSREIIPHLVKGDKMFNLPLLDPFEIKELKLSHGQGRGQLNLTLRDVKLQGLKDAYILNYSPWELNVEVHVPGSPELNASVPESDPRPSTSDSVSASDCRPSTSGSVSASDCRPSTSGSVSASDCRPSTSSPVSASDIQSCTSGYANKRKVTKTLNKQSQKLVCNAYEYVTSNNIGNGHISETAKIMKLDRKTVRKIVQRGPVTPKKPGNKKVKFSKIDDFCCDLIRREMYKFFHKGQPPTVAELLKHLQNV
ncbi:hypothetical protein ANN_10246 [Periplaneta americana]|uniref:Uncharacterized protein n=1 Tax=Periplaneta americana TaxID=6978 RepID=A0ABQ8TRA1_PERAM|nr:hypothetical protein ANN_10246 [Periplaneta americana]